MAAMRDDAQPLIVPGDTWTLFVGGVHRHTKVVAKAATGWWQCVDVETGIAFAASERWFVDRFSDDPTDDA
jgi:hypothetical protein